MTHTRILGGLGLVVLTVAGLAPAQAEESWSTVHIAGAKVGSIHTTLEPFKDQGRDRVRVMVDLSLSFQRLGAVVTIRMRQATVETRDGSVQSVDTRTLAGGPALHIVGTLKNGRMTLTIDGPGQHQQQTLDWGPEVRGPYAVEQSLAREPIKPGEKRDLKMFLTDLNKVGDITLTAKASEEVPLARGAKRSLLRVEQTTRIDGKPRSEFDMTLWVDPKGEVQKTSSDNLGGMVTYRTTKKDALAPAPAGRAGVAPFDQIASSIVKVSPPIARPSASRLATYRISLKDDDPAQVVPADRRQSLKPGGAKNTMILDVKTAGPDAGAPGPAEVEPETPPAPTP